MRSFIAAMKRVPNEARALVGALALAALAIGVFAPMVAVATPTKTPKIVIAAPVKNQAQLFAGDPVAHVGISELFCRLSCNPVDEEIKPTKVKTVSYRQEPETIRVSVQNHKPAPAPKQQGRRK